MSEETTNQAAEEVEVPGANEVDTNDDDLDPDAAGGEQTAEDDSEDVEHEGKTYRIPKALKPSLMMHADYTKKTQETAAEKRVIDEERQAVHAERTRVSSMNDEEIQARGQLALYQKELQPYQSVNWVALQQQDPDRAQAEYMRYQQLKDGQQMLAGNLQNMASQRTLDTQRYAAKQAEEGQAILKRDIPGWGPELQDKVAQHARSLGFNANELAGITDPRVVKVLHQAFQASQIIQKQTAKPPQAQATASTTLAARAAPNREPKNETADQWAARRNKELREKRKGR